MIFSFIFYLFCFFVSPVISLTNFILHFTMFQLLCYFVCYLHFPCSIPFPAQTNLVFFFNMLLQRASSMCFFHVLLQCASSMCFFNVLLQRTPSMCFFNMLLQRASSMCFFHVASYDLFTTIPKSPVLIFASNIWKSF